MSAYYALVEQEGDSAFGVSFPDLPSVFSAADREEDIVANAMAALHLWAEVCPNRQRSMPFETATMSTGLSLGAALSCVCHAQ